LEHLKAKTAKRAADAAGDAVKECLQPDPRGLKAVEMERITHHDLRHLFATRCIEAGVTFRPGIALAGHKDGGALAMRVYGHCARQSYPLKWRRKFAFLATRAVAA